mgnify:CR=1 FL=1
MNKILLSTFVLTGTVDSADDFLAMVEINTNPPAAEPSYAVMAKSAFPCEVKEGTKFYILKLTKDDIPVIICEHVPPPEESHDISHDQCWEIIENVGE